MPALQRPELHSNNVDAGKPTQSARLTADSTAIDGNSLSFSKHNDPPSAELSMATIDDGINAVIAAKVREPTSSALSSPTEPSPSPVSPLSKDKTSSMDPFAAGGFHTQMWAAQPHGRPGNIPSPYSLDPPRDWVHTDPVKFWFHLLIGPIVFVLIVLFIICMILRNATYRDYEPFYRKRDARDRGEKVAFSKEVYMELTRVERVLEWFGFWYGVKVYWPGHRSMRMIKKGQTKGRGYFTRLWERVVQACKPKRTKHSHEANASQSSS